MEKYIQDNPEWAELAHRVDDLKWVLIKFGKSFSKPTLKVIQKEYKLLDKRCTKLEKKLGDEGWWTLS